MEWMLLQKQTTFLSQSFVPPKIARLLTSQENIKILNNIATFVTDSPSNPKKYRRYEIGNNSKAVVDTPKLFCVGFVRI